MYGVIFTYNFDHDSSISLFETLEEAQNYLVESYEEEKRIETEENGWDVECSITDDKTYASIVHSGIDPSGEEYRDICEYHLACNIIVP